jgi:hypothetical protein
VIDPIIQALQRAYAADPSFENEARLLAARVRAGDLPAEAVVLAASLGHPAARLIAPDVPTIEVAGERYEALQQAFRLSPLLPVRFAIAAAERVLPIFERSRPDSRPRAAIEAARVYATSPSPRAARKAAWAAAWAAWAAASEAAAWAAAAAAWAEVAAAAAASEAAAWAASAAARAGVAAAAASEAAAMTAWAAASEAAGAVWSEVADSAVAEAAAMAAWAAASEAAEAAWVEVAAASEAAAMAAHAAASAASAAQTRALALILARLVLSVERA